jgi:hypothetical protein
MPGFWKVSFKSDFNFAYCTCLYSAMRHKAKNMTIKNAINIDQGVIVKDATLRFQN